MSIVSVIGGKLLGEAKGLIEEIGSNEAKKKLRAIQKGFRMIKRFEKQFEKGKIEVEEKEFLISMVKKSMEDSVGEKDEN